MGDVFDSYSRGWALGSAQAEERRTQRVRNALAGYQTDPKGARNALLGLGAFDQLEQLDRLDENTRQRTVRDQIAALHRQNGQPQLIPTQQPQAQAQAQPQAPAPPTLAGEQYAQAPQTQTQQQQPQQPQAPTPDQAKGIAQQVVAQSPLAQELAIFEANGMYEQASAIRQQIREEYNQNIQLFASAANQLLQMPEAQRMPAAQAMIQNDPRFANSREQLLGQLQQMDADHSGTLSDAELQGFRTTVMTVGEQVNLEMQRAEVAHRAEREAVDDRHWQAGYDLQREQMLRSTGDVPLTPQQRRLVRNDEVSYQDQAVENLGNMRMVLPYADLVTQGGGTPPGMNSTQVRLNDVALLRAAARAQTGVGVLTESEVMGTLSPSLQQELRTRGAYFDESRVNLSPEARAALADFVNRSSQWVQRQAWNHYEGTERQLPGGTTMDSAGIPLPRLPHPDDIEALRNTEIGARAGATRLQVGDIRATQGGRRYRYLGPGNWELVDRAGGYDEASAQAARQNYQQRAPQQQQRAGWPRIGYVEGGYRYKGGDPHDRRNWERVGRTESPEEAASMLNGTP